MSKPLALRPQACECRSLCGALDDDSYAAWQQVLATMPDASPFACPEWVDLAARCGMVSATRLLIARDAGRPIAVIPIQQTGPHLWEVIAPLSMTGATMVIDPAYADLAWTQVGAWLRAQGVAALRMTLCGDAPPVDTPAPLPGACQELSPGQVVPLAESWDAFVQGRGRSTRRKLNTLATRLQEGEPGLSIELIDQEAGADAAIADLVRLYRQRWGDQVGGSTLCAPSCADFFHRVMRWALREGHGVIPLIRYHGRTIVIGTVLAMPGQQTAYYHFTVRDTTVEAPVLANSPGTALAVAIVRWAIARNFTQLNMGRGNNRYKQLLGGEPLPFTQRVLATSTLAASLLPGISRGLHILQRLPMHLSYRVGQLVRHSGTCAEPGDE
jgi:CelD/BcsL family acetyltransferase involved in cellulose biosynthesis